MRRNRVLAGVGTVAVAAVALVGCSSTGPTGNPSGPTSDPSASSEAPSSGAPQDVTFWGSWSGDQVDQLNQLTDLYNASQTTYKVTYVAQEQVEQKLLTALVGGQVPDVVMWDRPATAVYAPKGALTPIDDLIARDKVDVSQFYAEPASELVFDGKTYGLPLLVDNRSLFYNKTLFAAAGLQPPATWDEVVSDAKALTVRDGSGKLTRAGFPIDPGMFSQWMREAGGQMLNDDQTKVAFNSEQGKEVLAFWKQLIDDGSYEIGFGEGTDPFAEGNLAMKLDGPWALPGLDAAGVDYGIVPPPAGPDGDKGANTGGFGLVIPQGAKNVDGAWDFIKWWTTEPANGVAFAKISGWIPANIESSKDGYFTGDEHYKAFIDTMQFAKVRPQSTAYPDVEGKALVPELQKFLSGQETADQALANAETMGNQILAQNHQ